MNRQCLGCHALTDRPDRYCLRCDLQMKKADEDDAKPDAHRLRGGRWVTDRHGIQRWKPWGSR